MTAAPLSALLSQILIALSSEYARQAGTPPLPLWANVLRVVPDEGLRRVDAARSARVSRRAMAAMVTGAARTGLVSVDEGAGRGPTVLRLTDEGRRARETGGLALGTAEQAWVARLGDAAPRFRDDLRTHVRRLDLELPHFPIGYGPADASITGGRARPGSDGPPRIPPHGADWIPVPRTKASNAVIDVLPLTALLSQVLVAFAIDFEDGASPLAATVIWREVPDAGLRAADLPNGAPNPSGWERHGLATLHPTPLEKRSIIRLTAPARAARDGYVARATAIEETWSRRYGDVAMAALRRGAEAIVESAGLSHLPHFPRVSWVGALRDVSLPR